MCFGYMYVYRPVTYFSVPAELADSTPRFPHTLTHTHTHIQERKIRKPVITSRFYLKAIHLTSFVQVDREFRVLFSVLVDA